eukprot:12929591-Prorocentrum_lima.AAC.1
MTPWATSSKCNNSGTCVVALRVFAEPGCALVGRPSPGPHAFAALWSAAGVIASVFLLSWQSRG